MDEVLDFAISDASALGFNVASGFPSIGDAMFFHELHRLLNEVISRDFHEEVIVPYWLLLAAEFLFNFFDEAQLVFSEIVELF